VQWSAGTFKNLQCDDLAVCSESRPDFRLHFLRAVETLDEFRYGIRTDCWTNGFRPAQNRHRSESSMFDIHENRNRRSMRMLAAGLALLSLVSLIVTVLITLDVLREQEIVTSIVQHLPKSDLEAVKELSGSLRLNARLGILMVLNVIGTAVALGLVLRGYMHSERSLRDVKVLASDILASVDAAVITTDRHGMMTSINVGGRELIGLNDDCIGRYLTDID